ncbi:hypothetical protein AYO45_04005 [Gammaproteobacteria bacterium SCGC AG-212-F23]|nr:hypothetical protein AYO45_04005 [Gammaproteobacteria bacterium SCGC AG-212-F23]
MVFLFASSVCALTTDLKQKYPYTVLTDDYGILNGRDLDSKLDGVFPPTEFPSGKHFFLYWQCFPREQVRISLNDIGYSSFNLDENDAELTITVYTSSGAHLYGNRRNSAVSSSIKTLNEYQRIMRGQHYICLEGTYFFYKDSVTDGKKMRTYYWTFEKMKTMKGCVSYFLGKCHDKKIKVPA